VAYQIKKCCALHSIFLFDYTNNVFTLFEPELSIILGLELEVSLGMSTYRAHFGSSLANVQVTTVAALPDAIAVAAKY
jgi:hypothetical protein